MLNVLGWIVAGLVTLGGVLVAHWIRERSATRREDRVRIYEPLRKEVDLLLRQRAWNAVRDGRFYWTPSDEFEEIRRRGVLRDKRHDALRADIDLLLELSAAHERNTSSLYDVRESAGKAAWTKSEAKSREVSQSLTLTEALGVTHSDSELTRAVMADDKDAWVTRLDVIVQGARGRIAGLELVGKAGAIYDEISEKVKAAREAYRRGAGALLDHAEVIRSRLDSALRDGSRYRGS